MNRDDMRLIQLDDSYFQETAELFSAVFGREPWNDDWSDKTQLGEYMREIMNSYNALNFGLLIDGRLAAASIGAVRHWWEGTNYNIEELFVSPELQGRGIGTEFLKMIEAEIAERGLCGIFLQTDSDKPALRFYSRNGFGVLGGHVSLYKSLNKE